MSLDDYTVYDNTTNKIVACGTWSEVEDYAECEGRYSVIHTASGQKIS